MHMHQHRGQKISRVLQPQGSKVQVVEGVRKATCNKFICKTGFQLDVIFHSILCNKVKELFQVPV